MWRNKDLRRVVLARFISRTGGEAAFFVGIWGKAAFTFSATPAQLAVLMGTLSIASILGTIVSGVLIDRYDARRVLIAAEAFFVPVALAFILPTAMWQLTILAGLLGFFGAPVMTAAASFAPFLASEGADLDRINAWIEGAGSLSFVIGPGLGALLAQFVGLNPIFIFDAVTSLVAVVLVARVTLRRPEPVEHERTNAFSELREGLRYTYSHRALRYPILIGTVVWLGFGAFGALEPLFYRDVLHTGVAAIGWMNTLFGIGIVIGAWAFSRLPARAVTARGLALVSATVGLGALAYVGTKFLVVVAIGALVWGIVIGVADVLLRVIIQSGSPDHLVGRIAGVSQMHRQAGELVPLALAPMLAVAFGVQAVLIGGGLLMAAVALLSLPEARAVDRLPRLRAVRATGRPGAIDEPVSPNP
jgi:MFS transporter, DHA3 family, macrolide efflux protein